jgi:hypothetical protein
MLIKATGKCEKCGVEFGGSVTEQEVGLTCGSCGKESRRCRKCKKAGCECSGKLLDCWEFFEKKNPGKTAMF